MTANHTPGPWIINDQVDMLFIEADGAPVASVEVGEGPDEAEGAEADARLIVAAPVMAQLLRDFVAICDPMPLQAIARLKIEALAILSALEGE